MYTFISQFSSPNYTPEANARATYGQPRTYQAIAIHWWGDPAENPQFEGVVNHLCDPNAGVSSHFVATGTNRRVACLVNMNDIAWATVQANPFTISIECDPRCRDEDYDVVAELIADIRDAYGNLPLVPHNKYFATRCPGNWDLGRLDAIANSKVSGKEWGEVTDKVAKATADQIQALYQALLGRAADPGGLMTYTQQSVDQARANIMASQEYHDRQQALAEQAVKDAAAKAVADAQAQADAEKQSAAVSSKPITSGTTTSTPTSATIPTATTTTPDNSAATDSPSWIVKIFAALLSLFTKKKS